MSKESDLLTSSRVAAIGTTTHVFPGPAELRDHFELRRDQMSSVRYWAVIKPLTRDQARLVFLQRPFSPYSETRYGRDGEMNDAHALLHGRAGCCKMCTAITLHNYLDNQGICPDCNGRSQLDGHHPFSRPTT